MAFPNCYYDTIRAEAYAGLEFANTYHLAFRDLPELFPNISRAKGRWISAAERVALHASSGN